MAVDESGAIPMFVSENRVFNNNDHTWLVIHKTAGFHTAQQVASFFASDPNEASTHYVVGQDGTIVQCVAERDGAAGNCCLEAGHAAFLPTGVNLNTRTVSIEHVDPATDNSTPLTDAQKAASFKLVRDICQRHNIPMRPGDASGGIIGHKDIAPINRARCPGNYPWDELWAYLKGGQSPMQTYSPTSADFGKYFQVIDANHWKSLKYGAIIQDGILATYCKLSMDGNTLPLPGLPVKSEQYVTVDGSQVAVTVCERMALIYDPQHVVDSQPGMGDVYVMQLTDPRLLKLIPGLTLPTVTKVPDPVLADVKALLNLAGQMAKDAGVAS